MMKKFSTALLSFGLCLSALPSVLAQPAIVLAQEGQNEVNTIMAAGYLSVSADDFLNSLAAQVYGENGAWAVPVSGSKPKTLYAAFKLDPNHNQEEAYTVTFTNGDNSCTREITAKEGGLVYFALNEQDGGTLPTEDLKGTYVITLSKKGESTPLAQSEFSMVRMRMIPDGGCEGPERIVYLDERGLETAIHSRPHEYVFTGDSNAWNENRVERDGYDVTVYISAYHDDNVNEPEQTIQTTPSDHGSFTVSNLKAQPGDNVKISPVADQGYWTDQVSAVDAKGNPVSVRDYGDGTYMFLMPTAADSTPVTVSVTFKKINLEEHDCPGLAYSDFDPAGWYHEAVDYAINNGILKGKTNTTLGLSDTTKRAELVTMLHRLNNAPAALSAGFIDIPAGSWYEPAVNWAKSAGITTGVNLWQFAPEQEITREQLATMLYRDAIHNGKITWAYADLSVFPDANEISDYALDAMRWAVDRGIIVGKDNNALAPKAKADRAESAVMLVRYSRLLSESH